MYPVIVAVSVLTTFITPFLVRAAPKIIAFCDRVLPDKVKRKLESFQESKQSERVDNDSDWRKFLQSYFKNLLLYGAIAVGLILIVNKLVAPRIYALGYFEEHIGSYILGAVLFVLLLLLVPPLLRNRNTYFTTLWLKSRANRIPLMLLAIVRYCVACGILLLPGIMYWHIPPVLFALVVMPAIYFAAHSDRLSGQYLKIEANFLANFNERQLNENLKDSNSVGHSWLDEQLYVSKIKVAEDAEIAEKSLNELNWGNIWHVKIIRITHGKKSAISRKARRKLPREIFCVCWARKKRWIISCFSGKTAVTLRKWGKEKLCVVLSRRRRICLPISSFVLCGHSAERLCPKRLQYQRIADQKRMVRLSYRDRAQFVSDSRSVKQYDFAKRRLAMAFGYAKNGQRISPRTIINKNCELRLTVFFMKSFIKILL